MKPDWFYSVTYPHARGWTWKVFYANRPVCSGVSRTRFTAELVGRYRARRLAADAYHANIGG